MVVFAKKKKEERLVVIMKVPRGGVVGRLRKSKIIFSKTPKLVHESSGKKRIKRGFF